MAPQVSYSPDIALDFFLFAWLKLPFYGHSFELVISVKENFLQTLNQFHKNNLMACFDDQEKNVGRSALWSEITLKEMQ